MSNGSKNRTNLIRERVIREGESIVAYVEWSLSGQPRALRSGNGASYLGRGFRKALRSLEHEGDL